MKCRNYQNRAEHLKRLIREMEWKLNYFENKKLMETTEWGKEGCNLGIGFFKREVKIFKEGKEYNRFMIDDWSICQEIPHWG